MTILDEWEAEANKTIKDGYNSGEVALAVWVNCLIELVRKKDEHFILIKGTYLKTKHIPLHKIDEALALTERLE